MKKTGCDQFKREKKIELTVLNPGSDDDELSEILLSTRLVEPTSIDLEEGMLRIEPNEGLLLGNNQAVN